MLLPSRTEKDEAPKPYYLIHIVDPTDDTDNPAGSSFQMTLENLQKLIHNVGFFDYNDEETATTPILVTEATSPVKITNDGLGAFTNKTYAPDGVTDIWKGIVETVPVHEFDFSELVVGDMIDIRVDLEVTTTQPNQFIDIDLRLGIGGNEYTIHFTHDGFKFAGVYSIFGYSGIYMGDANTLDNGGHFEISSDNNCSVKVNGWYCKIIKK